MELVWSKEWRIVGETPPIVTAGPDLRFELAGLSPELTETLGSWETTGSAPAQTSAPDEEELRALLVSIGALCPRLPERPSVEVTSTTPVPDLRAALSAGFLDVNPATPAAIELVVRTEAEWPTAGVGLHLGVDLTHHHTLVLGPFVVPGVTSCLRCLARQTERRWGEDHVAEQPRTGRWVNVVADLLRIQIELAQSGDYPLVNATATWDLHTGESERERLFRAPECGGPCRAPAADQIHLPWQTR